MRRALAILVVAIAAAVALSITAGARPSSKPASKSASTHTLHVVERATTDTPVDLGAHGDSTGDLLTFHNQVFDGTNARRVGTDLGHCVRIVPGESFDCEWTLFLPQGQITVYGPFFDKGDSVLAITGGTGAFRRARGQMRLHARSSTSFDFVYRIVR
jgi:allene oxide cyclase